MQINSLCHKISNDAGLYRGYEIFFKILCDTIQDYTGVQELKIRSLPSFRVLINNHCSKFFKSFYSDDL
jgi:hypothetical protein